MLFSDVIGSTELGERLDPEALRRVMERYFELAQRIVDGHGGTVEKFIGDAVMAVFGVPTLHEDDALRAVRAAADLRAELPALNAELKRDYDATLQLRTGVNTGEAVTATDDWLAVGDAVNVAARLEQAAAPGEILLGSQTAALVRDAVLVEALEPLALKGKAEPVSAYRLLQVRPHAGSPRRRTDTPMIGRAHQLRMLEYAFANVVRERACSLFTVLGVAGVGKSRLAAEFVSGLAATVVRGHCLSYGDGITYWPVTEVVQQLLAADDREDEPLTGGEDEERAIRALLDESTPAGSSTETAWAVRKLFERAAARKPLVVILDDVHWGEPTFLDLIEHVADLSRGAPIMLLCLARPELLERRPAWGGGKLNATTVLLEPLNTAEAEELIASLLPTGSPADPALRVRALEVSAGNPLFLEEIAASLASSQGNFQVPLTIQTLLAARLDQLDPAERRVLEYGSVEGNSFHRSAVEALGPGGTAVPTLLTLVRKDLVRPDKAALLGDDAFRFRHLLVRDAAYDGLPKSVRARLHEKFAGWLEERAGDLVERDEIIGYHLEQAYTYRRELGSLDAAAAAIAIAAARRLESAGRRAIEREDGRAALNLLERASALMAADQVDISLELSVVWALFEVGRIADAAARAEAASARAAEAGDQIGRLRAELARVDLLSHLQPEQWLGQLAELVERARPVFDRAGDDAALGSLGLATWSLEHYRCRFGAAADAAARACEHFTAAGEDYLANWCSRWSMSAIIFGPMPVTEVLAWLDHKAAQIAPRPIWLGYWRARVLPLIGRFDEARTELGANVERLIDQGDRLGVAISSAWSIEIEAGEYAAAEQAARQSCGLLEEIGARSYWSTHACEVAVALYHLGRYAEAKEWASRALETGARDDAVTQLMGRQVLAKVAARQDQFDRARALAGQALAIADGMDAPEAQGYAALDVAEVFWLAGDDAESSRQAVRAGEFFRRKGATIGLERASRLAEAIARGVAPHEYDPASPACRPVG